MTCDPATTITSAELTGLNSDIQTIDDVVESSLDTTTTKNGKTINTLLGQLKLLGYLPPVTYAGAIAFGSNDNTKTIDRNGIIYAPKPSELPFTTSGTWAADDENKFFVIQSVTLTSDQSYSYTADTVANMIAATDIVLGQRVVTEGHSTAGDGAGAEYLAVALQATDGFGDHSSGSLSFLLQHNGSVDVRQYGVSKDVADNSAAIAACFNAAKNGAFEVTAHTDEVYDYQSDIVISGATSFTLTGAATFNGINVGIAINGTLTEVGTVNAAANKGANSVTLTAVGSLAENDVIVLWNSTASSLSIHRTNYYDGEMSVVKSVAGNIVTLENPLLTGYSVAATNKAYKMAPVIADINGVSFTGGSLYPLSVYAAAFSNINPKEVVSNSNATAAVLLSRCYAVDCSIERVKKPDALSGTDYGISISNSQHVKVKGGDIYGGRHAVATGGDANAGAVPCRDIKIMRCTLKNDTASGTHTADFHGNTIDSEYIDCTIYGWTGIGGRNCGVRGGQLIPTPGQALRPFQWLEIVGGEISFTGIKAEMPAGNIALAGANSSVDMQDIEENFKIIIDDIDLNINAASTSVAVAFIGNYADGAKVDWDIQLTRFRITGNVTSLDRFVNLDSNNAGGFAAPPNALTNFVLDDITMDISGLSFWVINGGSMLATGTIATMPKLEKSANVTILNGGYISTGALIFNFPSYVIAPNVTPMTDGRAVAGSTYVTPIITGSTATSATVFLGTMHTSETVSVQVDQRVSARVGFDGFVWP